MSLCIAGRGSGPPGSSKDEPEAAVLLVACAIGLVTGGGVVLFNNAIHSIRHLAFQVSTVQISCHNNIMQCGPSGIVFRRSPSTVRHAKGSILV